MNKLDEIFLHKRVEVEFAKQARPLELVQAEARQTQRPQDFVAALRQRSLAGSPALIAEVKRASPSRGPLAPCLDPALLVRQYQGNGAAAISVLTDQRFFQGSLDDLRRAAEASRSLPGGPLPLLRKDFILDAYQIYEARAAGASAVLLIAAYLNDAQLAELHALALQLDLAPLVEVHDEQDLQRALPCQPKLVGINNRSLRDFSVDLDTTLRLRPCIPAETCLVAESGIHSAADVRRLGQAGVDAILVGEALVTAVNLPEKVRELAYVY